MVCVYSRWKGEVVSETNVFGLGRLWRTVVGSEALQPRRLLRGSESLGSFVVVRAEEGRSRCRSGLRWWWRKKLEARPKGKLRETFWRMRVQDRKACWMLLNVGTFCKNAIPRCILDFPQARLSQSLRSVCTVARTEVET